MLLVSKLTVIRNILLPSQELLDSLGQIPAGIRASAWDFSADPVELPPDEVDAVVLPYLGSLAALKEPLSRLPNLKLLHTQTTGYDGVAELVGPEVAICSAAGVHAASTAELAIGLILSSLRGLDIAARDQANERWRHERRTSLADRKVLLIGVGGIGGEIRRRLTPFEVSITRVGRTRREDGQGTVHGFNELALLAADHDVVIAVVPLTEETDSLIGRDFLAALPDGALVVNVGRGAVVDSDAITAEVVSGRLHAALDVFEPEPLPAGHPLWQAPNALITPHLGGNSSAFPPRISALLRRQLSAFAQGERPQNLVRPGIFQD